MNRSLFGFVLATFLFAAFPGCGVKIPDPCTLVTIEEMRAIAPDVTYAKPVDPLTFQPTESQAENAGIKSCVWRNAADKDQVLLTSKAGNSDPVEPALKNLLKVSTARVVAVPSIGPNAAAAFYGSGEGEILAILIAQEGKVFLDLRPLGVVGAEKSARFAAAASLVKRALERGSK